MSKDAASTRGGSRTEKEEKLKVAPKFACNYSEPLYRACLRGRGIAYLPISESLLDVLEGRLEVVLPEYRGILVDIWAFMHLPRINHLSLKNFLPTLSELLKRSWLIRLNKEPRRIKSYSAQ